MGDFPFYYSNHFQAVLYLQLASLTIVYFLNCNRLCAILFLMINLMEGSVGSCKLLTDEEIHVVKGIYYDSVLFAGRVI